VIFLQKTRIGILAMYEDEKPPDFTPPRALKGRKARRIWRDLAPKCDARGMFDAGSQQLLAVLCALLAEAGDDPSQANREDLAQIRGIGRSLAIFR
jgi:hypothetical protein